MCSHCFVRAGISERSSLSVGLVKNIISDGYDLNYRHLHITGGEPLLWNGLFEALDHAMNTGYQTIFLNTNGAQLSPAVSRRLALYRGLSISISLEGPQALHDRVRGEGSYTRTLEHIENVLDAGIDLFIFTTVRKSLIHELPNFVHKVYKKFPDIQYLTLIQLIRVPDDTFDLSKELLESDDFLRLVKIASLFNLGGFKIYILSNPLAGVASKLLKMPWIPKSHPLYSDGSIFIKANRDITLSHSCRSSFGKYEPGMIAKVLASDAYRNLTAPDKATCPSCKYSINCMENDMIRPSEWYRDMHPGVPYCKRVLDRAAA
jgi:MoaA/NifB/PqqE/SkfB family radical SAM enzyme